MSVILLLLEFISESFEVDRICGDNMCKCLPATCTHAVSYCHHPHPPPVHMYCNIVTPHHHHHHHHHHPTQYTCIFIFSHPPAHVHCHTVTHTRTRALSYCHTFIHVYCHIVRHPYTCIVMLSHTRTRGVLYCHTNTRTRGVPYCDAHTLHVIRPTTAESNPRVSFLTRHTCPDTHVQTSMDR